MCKMWRFYSRTILILVEAPKHLLQGAERYRPFRPLVFYAPYGNSRRVKDAAPYGTTVTAQTARHPAPVTPPPSSLSVILRGSRRIQDPRTIPSSHPARQGCRAPRVPAPYE